METKALDLIVRSLGGDYELIRELGRGATAIVYLLRDHDLDRDVAMKVIRAGVGTDEESVARLEREAHLVAQLHHPNIVKLFSTHRLEDGSVVLLMEHVPGRNLKEILESGGPLPAEQALEVLKDIASALAYAHRRRIVHRDVKPENIYVDEEVGAARLADFGVARPWDQDSRLTLPGASLGTPAYMSPEQIDGKEVDGRSDVYSLGLVGYEMILGHHPWEGENVFTMIFKQKNDPLDLDILDLEQYPALSTILETALQKDPALRWESAAEMLKVLREVRPLRRRDDPLTLIGDPSGERRDSEGPAEGPHPPIEWPDFGSQTEAAPTPAPLDWSVDDPHLTAPSEATPLVARRGKSRIGFWAVLAAVLVLGFYGAFRVFFSSGGVLDAPESLPPGARTEGPPSLETESREPATPPTPFFRYVSGQDAQGPAGSLLELAAEVSDGGGNLLVDIPISLQVVEGDGILRSQAVRTGEDGVFRVGFRLPTQAGPAVVQARIPDQTGPGAEFRLQALPTSPLRITPLVGDGQSAPPSQVLPTVIGVRVLDEFGNPVPNTPVRFRVDDGGGRTGPADTVTDDVGRAFGRWTLGPAAGVQRLSAVAPGARDSVTTFLATAVASSEEDPVSPDQPSAAVPSVTPEPPRIRVRNRPFAIGGSQVCGLRGGAVSCRGSPDRGWAQGGPPDGYLALTAGVSHTCGLGSDGAAWCWGANESGQLGDGTTTDHSSPVPVGGEGAFSMLTGGLSHTCGLDGAGAAHCWGRNLNGQLGDGARRDRDTPRPASGDLSFASLVAGWNHTCGRTGGGQAYCWGLNGDGQLGDGTRVDRLVPTRVPGTFRILAAGASHTCGSDGSEVRCWGSNQFGQLGTGGEGGIRSVPATVTGLPSVPMALAAGAVHTCALLADGSTYCWGQNLHGQLGDGTTGHSPVPVPVEGSLRFAEIYAGGAITCGVTAEGAHYCWGFNQGGQLGDGTRTNRSTPVRVGGS